MGGLKIILTTFVSLGLFVGGIILLVLRIPFWSLFLGLPSVQIGIIFIIFTFDELSQKESENELAGVRQIPCTLCGKPTFIRGVETQGTCGECDKKFLKLLEKI